MAGRTPTLYLPHGGGPWPFLADEDDRMGLRRAHAPLGDYLRALAASLPARPRALLVVSAHWEAAEPTVTTAAAPPMLYDYTGFPPRTYHVRWPAPGDPELARKVAGLLTRAGFETAEDPRRGYDHGTFVPLAVAFPEAEIPTVQLSLERGLDPSRHLAFGRALEPLRDEGVLILGSGMSYHNMRGFNTAAADADSRAFDTWLVDACGRPPNERAAALAAWADAPRARACHPREEHLLPLMVVAGAAGDDPGAVAFQASILGARVSAIAFGG